MSRLVTESEQVPPEAKIVLLISGGRDSAVVGLVATALSRSVTGFTVDYPGRPERERRAASTVAQALGIPLTTETLSIPDARVQRPDLAGSSYEAWFPFRNLVFVSLAAAYAVTVGATLIAAGIRRSDAHAFGDSDTPYLAALSQLFERSGLPDVDRQSLMLFLPLLEREADPRTLLDEAGVSTEYVQRVLTDSRSCWRDLEEPCGECVACRTQLPM